MVGTTQTAAVEAFGGSESTHDARELADRCLEDDQAAWECLFRRYQAYTRRVAACVLGKNCASCVDDVVQEAFRAIVKHLHSWEGDDWRSLDGWIGKITRRRAFNRLRLQGRWSQERERAVSEIVLCECSYKRQEEQRELRDAFDAASKQLSQQQQTVFQSLREGRTQREIATLGGLSRGAVGKAVKGIHERLENFFREFQEESLESGRQNPDSKCLDW